MPTLYRYHYKTPQAGEHYKPERLGEVGNEVAGFESFDHALEQVEKWSKQGWEYWIDPQKGIEIPRNIADSDADLVAYTSHVGSGKKVLTPSIYHKDRSIDRWRHLFDLHGYDEEFDETRLAPELSRDSINALGRVSEGDAVEEYLLFDVAKQGSPAPDVVCRLDRSAVSERDWTRLLWANNAMEKSLIVKELGAPLVPVSEDVDPSLLDIKTSQYVRPDGNMTLQVLRAHDSARDRDLSPEEEEGLSP